MADSAIDRGARRRAEACFAVARSATFEGEREAAISRGKAIAERAGLSLDSFDIPGRERSVKARENDAVRQFAADLFGSRTVFEEVFMAYEAALRETNRRHSDAAAREFADAVKAEREARQVKNDADRAVAFLRARGVMVRRIGLIDQPRRWIIPGDDREFTDGGVYEQAILKGMVA